MIKFNKPITAIFALVLALTFFGCSIDTNDLSNLGLSSTSEGEGEGDENELPNGDKDGGNGDDPSIGGSDDGKGYGEDPSIGGNDDGKGNGEDPSIIGGNDDGKGYGEDPSIGGNKQQRCENGATGTFTDSRDGKEYAYVTICEQTWMAENLNFNAEKSKCYGEDMTFYSDDDKISDSEVQSYCSKYGRLYLWETALTACPEGWHLPSYDEWYALLDNTNELSYVYDDGRGSSLRSASGWDGQDTYGFNALPGGWGDTDDKESYYAYTREGEVGMWHSSSMTDSDSDAHVFGIGIYNSSDYGTYVSMFNGYKTSFLSIRCIKD